MSASQNGSFALSSLCHQFFGHLLQAQEIAAKPSKHPPIVYTASDSIQAPESPRKVTPKKESKPLSATERAEQELAVFKDMQTLEIHLDAPAAFKPSPSGSDSEAGGTCIGLATSHSSNLMASHILKLHIGWQLGSTPQTGRHRRSTSIRQA